MKIKAEFDSSMAYARQSFTAAETTEAIMEDYESKNDNSTSIEDDLSNIEQEVEKRGTRTRKSMGSMEGVTKTDDYRYDIKQGCSIFSRI